MVSKLTLSAAYLGLGSNLGDRRLNIERALKAISEASEGLVASSLYESVPRGFSDQPPFLNAVCGVWTRLTPFELLRELASIETAIGRHRTFPNAPRVLDIDILTYGGMHIETPTLTIPHPRIAEREFVLVPLAEIAPGLKYVSSGKTVRELLHSLGLVDESIRRMGSLQSRSAGGSMLGMESRIG